MLILRTLLVSEGFYLLCVCVYVWQNLPWQSTTSNTPNCQGKRVSCPQALYEVSQLRYKDEPFHISWETVLTQLCGGTSSWLYVTRDTMENDFCAHQSLYFFPVLFLNKKRYVFYMQEKGQNFYLYQSNFPTGNL